jgi:hypothetical protein
LKFNRSFENRMESMSHSAVLPSNVAQPGEVPMAVRFLGKLVLEVLPAALASVIGAFLFAHYQFDRPASPQPATPAMAATPASAEMMQLVRDEHAIVHSFLAAQQAAALKEATAANAADARADAQAKLAAAASRRAASLTAAKPAVPRGIAIAAAAPGSAATALPTIMVAAVQPNPAAAMPGPPPRRPSLIAQTLAVPGRVASVTLHAVMAIGGIPSWIGHRFGGDLESAAPLPSTSS